MLRRTQIRAARALAVLALVAPARARAQDQSGAEAPAARDDRDPCVGVDGCILADDGSVRDEATDYQAVTARPRPSYWRAAGESVLGLVGGTAWYWIDRERQVADWDFPSVRQRFTLEAWRYDNNPFGINFIWHASSGTLFHLAARSNDLSLPVSFGYGFMSSMVWEYALEFREKISINDVLVTPGAGMAMGEFFHWLGRYLHSAPRRGTGHRIAAWTGGIHRSVHNAIDGASDAIADPTTDNLGLSAAIWHRFRLSAGTATISGHGAHGADLPGAIHQLHVNGVLAALPGYLRPGRSRRAFADGNISAFELTLRSGDGRGVDLRADSLFLGVHWRDIPGSARDGIGRALTLGTSIGYQYRRERMGGWQDRLGILHLPGLAAEAHWLAGRWRLSLLARLHGDFAGANALAHDDWLAEHDDTDNKTTLRKQGYYFGWGGSGRFGLELVGPGVAIGGEASYGVIDSDEGLDRNQELLTGDVHLRDRVFDARAWLRGGLFDTRLYLELSANRRSRHSRVGSAEDDALLEELTVSVGSQL